MVSSIFVELTYNNKDRGSDMEVHVCLTVCLPHKLSFMFLLLTASHVTVPTFLFSW